MTVSPIIEVTGTGLADPNLTGTGLADRISELGGDDELFGNGGNDVLIGGEELTA